MMKTWSLSEAMTASKFVRLCLPNFLAMPTVYHGKKQIPFEFVSGRWTVFRGNGEQFQYTFCTAHLMQFGLRKPSAATPHRSNLW